MIRKREWIQGDENELSGRDNVFSITGSWDHHQEKMVQRVRTQPLLKPLIRNLACQIYCTSGVVEIKTEDKTSQLNYGDGHLR